MLVSLQSGPPARVFCAMGWEFPALRRKPLLTGPLFGLVVYCVMYYIVLPLFAAGARASYVPIVLINNLGIHAFGVGLPIAVIASRILGTEPAAPAPRAMPQTAR